MADEDSWDEFVSLKKTPAAVTLALPAAPAVVAVVEAKAPSPRPQPPAIQPSIPVAAVTAPVSSKGKEEETAAPVVAAPAAAPADISENSKRPAPVEATVAATPKDAVVAPPATSAVVTATSKPAVAAATSSMSAVVKNMEVCPFCAFQMPKDAESCPGCQAKTLADPKQKKKRESKVRKAKGGKK